MRGGGDDGLLQRFQLAVWPDVSKEWRNVDRSPDYEARDAIELLIERIVSVTNEAEPEDILALRFDSEAQEFFDAWRGVLERRLREDQLHPMIEAHLAKYRSLVPSLALLSHVAEGAFDGFGGPIDTDSVTRAILWAEYLEPHANRIYAPAISPEMDAARALVARIESGDIGARFNLRHVYHNGWSGLSTRDDVAAAVSVLDEYDWLREHQEQTAGRMRTVYELNPVLVENRR